VCQVTDVGGIDDKSFNATAWAGAQAAADAFGVETKFLESQQQTDYDKNINAFIEDGCDLIVTVGFLLGDATAAAAGANPDQNFAIIDVDYLDFPNVQGIGFAIDEAGFLAGYTAAGASETGIIGTFGGINIPPVTAFMDGYVMGADYYNAQNGTDVTVLGWDVAEQDGLFAGNFESTDDGRSLGESLLDEGADVIMPVAGPVGLGTAAAVQERGNAWIVGVDSDWTQTAPEFADVILTSVLKRMDTGVYSVTEQVVNGEFAGGVWVGTLANEGVGITDPVVAVDGIDAVAAGIIEGSIPTNPNDSAMMMDGDSMGAIMDMGGADLVVAVENAYPPFSLIDTESGEAVGYDYDMFREICSRMNCNPVFQETTWDAIVAIMGGGDYDEGGFDVAADGITITEERAQHVDFSRPYISLIQNLMVRADDDRIAGPDDLAGNDELLLGSQVGTTNYDVSVGLVGEDRVVTYDQWGLVIQALIQGDVDGVVLDNVAGQGYVGANPDKLLLLTDPLTNPEELGYVLRKGSDLTASLNATLDAMEADGTLAAIYDVWFGE